MKHLGWTREGRLLSLSTGQRAYKALIGQLNVALHDGSFVPYVWSSDRMALSYADLEARFIAGAVEIWRGSERLSRFVPRLQRKIGGAFRDELPRVRVEKLADEDQLEATVSARIALVLETDHARATVVFVAGCRDRARLDTEVVAKAVGEHRVVVDHELRRVARETATHVIDESGWRVAWTSEEAKSRVVRRTARGIRIELPSVRRRARHRAAPVLWVSPDTIGPLTNTGSGNDSQSDGTTLWIDGIESSPGDTRYEWQLYVDDSDPGPQDCVGLRWASINLGGRPTSIDAGTQITCDRSTGDTGGGGGPWTVRTKCQDSNTPATASAGDRPFGRSYRSASVDTSVPASNATLNINVQSLVSDLVNGAAYSYSGGTSDAIMFGVGGANMWGISTVSWSHIASDERHATGTPAQLTIVFTPSGGTTIQGSPSQRLRATDYDATEHEFELAGWFGGLTARSWFDEDLPTPTVSGFIGTLSQTLGALTAVGTGVVRVAGATSATLGTLTSSSAGAVAVAGVLAQTLGSLTSASAGSVAVKGDAAPTLGALTSSAAGAVAVQGTLAKTLDAVTLASAGTVTSGGITGALSVTLDALTASSSGQVAVKGDVAKTLDALTSSAAGVVLVKGTGAPTLGTLTSSSAGAVAVQGTLAKTLGALTSTSAAGVLVQGATGTTLGELTSAAAGQVAVRGSGSPTLDAITSASAGGVLVKGALAATLGDVTLSASGTLAAVVTGSLTSALGALTAAGSGVAAVVGSVAQTLGALTASSLGTVAVKGSADATLGALTSSSAGRVAIVGDGAATLDSLTVASTGTARVAGSVSATLEGLTSSAAGVVLVRGASSVTLGPLTVLADGSVKTLAFGSLVVTLGPLTALATGVVTTFIPVIIASDIVSAVAMSTDAAVCAPITRDVARADVAVVADSVSADGIHRDTAYSFVVHADASTVKRAA
jgi:formylmethanofuran dehydrogenase subunit C